MKGGRLTFIFPHLNICRLHENKPPHVFLLRSGFCTVEIQTRVSVFIHLNFGDLGFWIFINRDVC